jgi:flagellar hook-basal body complex protein FliE
MADPLGFISRTNASQGKLPASGAAPGQQDGPAFKDVLLKSLNDVNKAQAEATRAVEDLQTGQRTDVEGVILATQKADNAFRMLQSLRNRMMEAYDEVKQVRV